MRAVDRAISIVLVGIAALFTVNHLKPRIKIWTTYSRVIPTFQSRRGIILITCLLPVLRAVVDESQVLGRDLRHAVVVMRCAEVVRVRHQAGHILGERGVAIPGFAEGVSTDRAELLGEGG